MTALFLYLLKVTFCSAVFYTYYHFAFRNTSQHVWNRIYLLSTCILSICIPILDLPLYHTTGTETSGALAILNTLQSGQFENESIKSITSTGRASFTIFPWIYTLIGFFLLIKFVWGMFRSFARSTHFEKEFLNGTTVVITSWPNAPFSFLKTIFWNNDIDAGSLTGKKILLHEMVHVEQGHSYDKILMEVVRAAFWCNPIFWIMRKELQVIHEFLADEIAVGKGGETDLASMILQARFPALSAPTFAHPFFQSHIKRRILMLTTTPNRKFSVLLKMFCIPALLVLLFAFAVRPVFSPAVPIKREMTVVIDAGHGYKDGKPEGARYGNLVEADLVLTIAQKIKESNQHPNLHIVLSRTTTDNVELKDRVQRTASSKADLFISLHLNMMDPQAQKTTSMSGFEVVVPQDDASFQKKSILFGSAMIRELSPLYATLAQPVKKQNHIWVLDKNVCPAVLIECGYLDNEKDAAFIQSRSHQDELASAILRAIQAYSEASDQ